MPKHQFYKFYSEIFNLMEFSSIRLNRKHDCIM